MSRADARSPARRKAALVVDKPAGPTSHDVVAVARRALGQPRIGHTGTLDPLATGVLPLLLGRATRLAQFLASSDKTYLATIQFGQATSSYDAAGDPVGPGDGRRRSTRAALEAALARFRGRQLQTPPAVSAKKVGGHRAYDLARRDTASGPDAGRGRGDGADAGRLRGEPRRGAGDLFGRLLRAVAGPRPGQQPGRRRAPGGAPPRAQRTVHAGRQRRARPRRWRRPERSRRGSCPWPTCCRIGPAVTLSDDEVGADRARPGSRVAVERAAGRGHCRRAGRAADRRGRAPGRRWPKPVPGFCIRFWSWCKI